MFLCCRIVWHDGPCGVCSFPMIFHSIVGKDEREEQSPSWFNVHEALLVLKYIEVGLI